MGFELPSTRGVLPGVLRWMLDHPALTLSAGIPLYLLSQLSDAGPAPLEAPPDFYTRDRTMTRREFPMPIQYKTAEEFCKEAAPAFGGLQSSIKDLFATIIEKGLQHPGKTLGLGGGLVGLGLLGDVGSDLASTLSWRLNKAVHPWHERIKAQDVLAENLTRQVGKGGGESLLGLAADIFQKGTGMATGAVDSITRQGILKGLMKNDPHLTNVDPKELMRSYDTMAKFAPTLAMDEGAVRSFLRESVMSQAPPGYEAISGLARAEKTVQDTMGG